jgi:hypothetical protein
VMLYFVFIEHFALAPTSKHFYQSTNRRAKRAREVVCALPWEETKRERFFGGILPRCAGMHELTLALAPYDAKLKQALLQGLAPLEVGKIDRQGYEAPLEHGHIDRLGQVHRSWRIGRQHLSTIAASSCRLEELILQDVEWGDLAFPDVLAMLSPLTTTLVHLELGVLSTSLPHTAPPGRPLPVFPVLQRLSATNVQLKDLHSASFPRLAAIGHNLEVRGKELTFLSAFPCLRAVSVYCAGVDTYERAAKILLAYPCIASLCVDEDVSGACSPEELRLLLSRRSFFGMETVYAEVAHTAMMHSVLRKMDATALMHVDFSHTASITDDVVFTLLERSPHLHYLGLAYCAVTEHIFHSKRGVLTMQSNRPSVKPGVEYVNDCFRICDNEVFGITAEWVLACDRRKCEHGECHKKAFAAYVQLVRSGSISPVHCQPLDAKDVWAAAGQDKYAHRNAYTNPEGIFYTFTDFSSYHPV